MSEENNMEERMEDYFSYLKENFEFYASREVRQFVITIRLLEMGKTIIPLIFENQAQEAFAKSSDGNIKLTFAEVQELLEDNDGENSIYLLNSENAYKNLVSILEDYVKDIMQYLFTKFPQHLFLKKEKIELSKLIEFQTLEELRERVIKEKVISLSYNNLADMVKYIEKEFSVAFNFKELVYELLVEITNVRNILVHNKGLINERFLANVSDEKYSLGARVSIPIESIHETAEAFHAVVEKMHLGLINKFCKKEVQYIDYKTQSSW